MAGSDDFSVEFWGVRGSIASPGPATVRYGGNTPCLRVVCGDYQLVLDAGTGLRPLGKALSDKKGLVGDLFFSHTHLDHICGLPFFSPAFNPDCHLRLWAGHLPPGSKLQDVLKMMMCPPLFPVPVEIFRARVDFNEFQCGDTFHPHPGVIIRTAPLDHPDGATGYRVEYGGKSICYVTDTNHVPGQPNEDILGLIQGADIVIYDAMFTEEEFARCATWGHSTWQEGARLCAAAGAKTLVIFHHDPCRTDDELDAIGVAANTARPGTVVAREGMVLTP